MVSFISIFAEYFICWWITLFIVLPIGMRSQQDLADVHSRIRHHRRVKQDAHRGAVRVVLAVAGAT